MLAAVSVSRPSPTFPISRESGAFFRMGLARAPGPFAGGSRAGAERLMAGLESCQLSLMNVDFCCRPLKSVLLWPGTMQEAKPRPPPTASRLQLLELIEMCIVPIWERLVSGNAVGVCGILTGAPTLLPSQT